MTKREAAILSAYTGIMIGKFEDLITYAEEKLRRPVFSQEFLDNCFKEDLRCIAAYDFFMLNSKLEDD
jgi:hypothetical protein